MRSRCRAVAAGLLLSSCSQPSEPEPTEAAKPASLIARVEIDEPDQFITAVRAKEVKTLLGEGTAWDDRRAIQMGAHGVEVLFNGIRKAKTIELERSNASAYEVSFFRANAMVGSVRVAPRPEIGPDRLVSSVVHTPKQARRRGFDRIRIVPQPETRYTLGGLRLDVPRQATERVPARPRRTIERTGSRADRAKGRREATPTPE